MRLLTTMADPFSAKILVARLGADGIVCELRGVDGPYPTGPAYVFVTEADYEDALTALGDPTGPDDDAPA